MLHQLNLSKGNSRVVLFTVAFLMFSLGIAAQVQVKGKVTDAQGNGLAGITVSVQNTIYSTATDVSGNYSLNANVNPGMHQIVFSGVGKTESEMQELRRQRSCQTGRQENEVSAVRRDWLQVVID